jgi:hypothetical protein
MADLSDVEEALTALVVGAVYPCGSGEPPANGVLTRVYRGWPQAAALDADLAAGYANVTIFSEPGGRNTTRHLNEWLTLPGAAATLTATVAGNVVTFGGVAAPTQLVGIMADATSYVHPTGANESPFSVAANLAALIRADRIALVSGASIVIPGAATLKARVVAEQLAMVVTRRQEQRFRITCWAADPEIRDNTAACIDAVLAALTFIALPDGSAGRIRFHGGAVVDRAEDAQLYRRDLVYSIEYPTTSRALLATMLFGDLMIQTSDQASMAWTV